MFLYIRFYKRKLQIGTVYWRHATVGRVMEFRAHIERNFLSLCFDRLLQRERRRREMRTEFHYPIHCIYGLILTHAVIPKLQCCTHLLFLSKITSKLTLTDEFLQFVPDLNGHSSRLCTFVPNLQRRTINHFEELVRRRLS